MSSQSMGKAIWGVSSAWLEETEQDAVTHAVFHATGKRIRHTPMRAEHLL